MSGVPHRRKEWDDLIHFAPRRAQDQRFSLVDGLEEPIGNEVVPAAPNPPPLDSEQIGELERDVFDALHRRAGQQRTEPRPYEFGPPPVDKPSRLPRKIAALAIGGVALAALIGTAWTTFQEAGSFFGSAPSTVAVKSEPMLTAIPVQGAADEVVPLGIGSPVPIPDATVRLSGYPKGTRISPGVQGAAGEWVVMASDLPIATVTPPRGYSGAMQITAELRDKAQRVLTRGTVQPTWTAPPTAAPPPTAAAPSPALTNQDRAAAPAVNAPAVKETRRIAEADLAVLIRRGEELLKTGDIPAARLLLERATEAGSARAAFLLGTSYEVTSPGRAANTETASKWFRRAAELGSGEAQQRLDASASAATR
jgi:hypothetical protein